MAKRCCKQFAVWDVGGALAKRTEGIAFGDVAGRKRCAAASSSLFGGCGGAIAICHCFR
ncbi:MAG: hypothetical protein PT120_01710 [Aphanizomenon gracile PMC649.10]|nr:hypothetical protein [Aphanizomenon gracile PMC638.10]MDM3853011.1 hypothetical protein [Aphanizomenon gracile PMC627.10]MDM3853657.1 hypothetical protein [Aphanizomenon gracile PMC649.10]MDM3862702.1 hypothetical protein [Aphanizomenon gracile PMC644.10]